MTNFRLRIKHPSGAEFEAEGPAELILSEKTAFLSSLGHQETTQIQPAEEKRQWADIAENNSEGLKLRTKHPDMKADTAALIILASGKYLNNAQESSALALAKAIKRSGFTPGRIDRLLAKANKEGLVKASGTKRSRAYQITDRGAERAWLEARKLEK
ncbi:MAG TPA: hypothetical protein PKI19_01060 [Elusimicrobiales bacterium]|nr:hypothetical protein [Elusimicrobiales bacterium]